MAVAEQEINQEAERRAFRRAERLLFEAKLWPAKIANLEAELDAMLPSRSRSVATTTSVKASPHDSSEPERWAMIRAEGPRAIALGCELRNLRRLLAAVERAKGTLNDGEAAYVILRYDQELEPYLVMRKLGIKRRSYFRLRQRAVGKVAECLREVKDTNAA